MFMLKHAYTQLTVFMLCSVFMCCLIVHFKPYYRPVINLLLLIDEVMVTIISYLVLAKVGSVANPVEGYNCSAFIMWAVRIHIVINLAFVIRDNERALITCLKRRKARI